MYQSKYRYDLNVRASNSSACVRNTDTEMTDMYKSIGIDGIVVTDTFTWKTPRFRMSLIGESGARGSMADNTVQRSAEIRSDPMFFAAGRLYAGTDFITLGLDNDRLTEHPKLKKLWIKEYLSLVRS